MHACAGCRLSSTQPGNLVPLHMHVSPDTRTCTAPYAIGRGLARDGRYDCGENGCVESREVFRLQADVPIDSPIEKDLVRGPHAWSSTCMRVGGPLARGA